MSGNLEISAADDLHDSTGKGDKYVCTGQPDNWQKLREHNQESTEALHTDFQPYLTVNKGNLKDAGTTETQQAVGKLLGCPTIVGKDGTIYLQGHVSNDLEGTFGVPSTADLEKIGTGLTRGIGHSTQATLEFLAQPNAVNDAAISLAQSAKHGIDYYSKRPDRISLDAKAASYNAGQVLLDTLGHPLLPERIGELAGNTMMMFTPIGGIKALGLNELEALGGAQKLEQMSAAELEQLGLKRTYAELQPASPELFEAIKNKGRTVKLAVPGSESFLHLESVGAEGAVINNLITVKSPGTKITVLEEFLHGTQNKICSFGDTPAVIREIHVKDFMIRHADLLRLNDREVTQLKAIKQAEVERAYKQGWVWKG